MSLVTLAKYKEYLNITDANKDTQINDLASAVEKRVLDYLNRNLESATYQNELYNGNGYNWLILDNFPITAITSISVYDGYYNNAEVWTTLVLGTNYERKLIEDEKVTLDGYTFVKNTKNYKVTYTAGYTTIPSSIQNACKELLKITWDNSPLNQNRLGFTTVSDSAGGSSVALTIDPEIESKILKKIEGYRVANI